MPDRSYDTDFYAWTQEQAARLRAKDSAAQDLEHLAEEIEDLGKRDRLARAGAAASAFSTSSDARRSAGPRPCLVREGDGLHYPRLVGRRGPRVGTLVGAQPPRPAPGGPVLRDHPRVPRSHACSWPGAAAICRCSALIY
jgi:hypothetical protein